MKYLIFSALFIVLLSTGILAQKTAPKTKKVQTTRKRFKKKNDKASFCDLYPSVAGLFVNQAEITVNCPQTKNSVNDSCQNGSPLINVAAVAPDQGFNEYIYTVSVGKIIGKGANVQWDLSGVAPRIYTITAGVDAGQGVLGQTKTQTVKIIECLNCH